MIDEGQVAETIAGTLNWAARQASNPLFKDIVGLDIGEIQVTLNLPGEQRYRLTVTKIDEEE